MVSSPSQTDLSWVSLLLLIDFLFFLSLWLLPFFPLHNELFILFNCFAQFIASLVECSGMFTTVILQNCYPTNYPNRLGDFLYFYRNRLILPKKISSRSTSPTVRFTVPVWAEDIKSELGEELLHVDALPVADLVLGTELAVLNGLSIYWLICLQWWYYPE